MVADERQEDREHANDEVAITPADTHNDSTDEYQQEEDLRQLRVAVDGTFKVMVCQPGQQLACSACLLEILTGVNGTRFS